MITLIRTKIAVLVVSFAGALLGISFALFGIAAVSLSYTDAGLTTLYNMDRAGHWVYFAGFAVLFAGLCIAVWRALPTAKWGLITEAGVGAVGALLLAIQALLTTTTTTSLTVAPTLSPTLLYGFGFGIWAGICIYHAARASIAEGRAGTVTSRTSILWVISAGALLLIAISQSLPYSFDAYQSNGMASGIMGAIGVAMLMGVVVFAFRQRLFALRSINLLSAGLGVLVIFLISVAVASGMTYTSITGLLSTFKVMRGIEGFSAAVAFILLAVAAWQRFSELLYGSSAQPSQPTMPASSVPTMGAVWAAGGPVIAGQSPFATSHLPPPPRPPRPHRGPNPVVRFVRTRTRTFWVISGGVVVVIIAAAIALPILSSINAASHAPSKAAANYLEAYSEHDVPVMVTYADVLSVSGDSHSQTFVRLTSAPDIAKELATPDNRKEPVSDIKVISTHITPTGDSASVVLRYISGGTIKTQNYYLVKSSTNAIGWSVDVRSARYTISVPAHAGAVTVAGIPVTMRHTVLQVTQFPSWVIIKMAATPIWAAQSIQYQSIATGSNQAKVPSTLQANVEASAKSAVVKYITSCLQATTFDPSNCSNTTTLPYSCTSTHYGHATCSAIHWTATSKWETHLRVSADRTTGSVDVSGTISSKVTYTVTETTTFTGKPTVHTTTTHLDTVSFDYPVTVSGTQWKVGKLINTSSSSSF